LYGFVRNNPISLIDPLGLADIQIDVTRMRATAADISGEFEAYATSSKISECCKKITGQTVEISRTGTKNSKGKQNYPLSEGNHKMELNTTAEKTGTQQMLSNETDKASDGKDIKYPMPHVPDWNDEDYNRNFVKTGTEVCIHYGRNSNYSVLCIIVGRNGSQVGDAKQTQFHPNDSAAVMIDLLKFYDCVEKKLGRTPSMQLTVKDNAGN